MPLTVSAALKESRERLAAASDSAALDAEVWLAHVLGQPRSWLLAHPEAELSTAAQAAHAAGLLRLAAGEPLPYLLGEWEFYGLSLLVSPAVLIPRPETELLVETALGWLADHPGRRAAADVGTGSACIPAALAAHCPDLQAWAGDISPEALAVAAANVARHGLGGRVRCIASDLMAALPGPYDLISANLPYIPEARLPELAVSRWEPALALGGGPDGLRLIEPFLQQAQARLLPGGLLLAEIDASLEAAVLALAGGLWPVAAVEVRPDLTGRPRLLVVQT
ncbi:MAG: peptide chain release factor N(5)-glutamine methyltransferase [Anaerolineales bacterium]|nr:peptide chain release factor N(5)-glutamine methyltransferase [Anaerolineales bacterium]